MYVCYAELKIGCDAEGQGMASVVEELSGQVYACLLSALAIIFCDFSFMRC